MLQDYTHVVKILDDHFFVIQKSLILLGNIDFFWIIDRPWDLFVEPILLSAFSEIDEYSMSHSIKVNHAVKAVWSDSTWKSLQFI